jgi:hypothetical protein
MFMASFHPSPVGWFPEGSGTGQLLPSAATRPMNGLTLPWLFARVWPQEGDPAGRDLDRPANCLLRRSRTPCSRAVQIVGSPRTPGLTCFSFRCRFMNPCTPLRFRANVQSSQSTHVWKHTPHTARLHKIPPLGVFLPVSVRSSAHAATRPPHTQHPVPHRAAVGVRDRKMTRNIPATNAPPRAVYDV